MGAQQQGASITAQTLDSRASGTRGKAIYLCWIWVASDLNVGPGGQGPSCLSGGCGKVPLA